MSPLSQKRLSVSSLTDGETFRALSTKHKTKELCGWGNYPGMVKKIKIR